MTHLGHDGGLYLWNELAEVMQILRDKNKVSRPNVSWPAASNKQKNC